LLSEGSLSESIENASRLNPGKVSELNNSLKDVISERNNAISLFTNSKNNGKEGCLRCQDDLDISDNPSITITDNNLKPKSLNNIELNNNDRGDCDMVKGDITKQLGMQNLSQIAGKAIVIGSKIVDKKVAEGGTVMDTVFKKPSTYINIGGGIALQLLGLSKTIKKKALKDFLVTAGSYMTAEIVTVAVEAARLDIGLGTGITARRRHIGGLSTSIRRGQAAVARGLPSRQISIRQSEFSPTGAGGVALF
ncbi:hypothetical protein LCGC14_2125190, partial [marine sediment metagenome]